MTLAGRRPDAYRRLRLPIRSRRPTATASDVGCFRSYTRPMQDPRRGSLMRARHRLSSLLQVIVAIGA